VVPFTRRRRLTADHMVYSKLTAPHVVTVAEVDLNKTARLRESNKDRYKKEGIGLTMLAFLCQAAVRALREFPRAQRARARRFLRRAPRRQPRRRCRRARWARGAEHQARRRAFAARSSPKPSTTSAPAPRPAKSPPTISPAARSRCPNPGIRGNLFGGAIIAQPNVGILRMGEIQKRVVVVDVEGQDTMAIHPVMFLALSYDHRVIDGVLGNAFLYRVTEILEKGDFEV